MVLEKDTQEREEKISRISLFFHERLQGYLEPLLLLLDQYLDRRLVQTFALLTEAILRFRHRNHGLLLSELGAYILSADKAPAGTKRISNLLRSGKWADDLLGDWLRQKAKETMQEWPVQPLLLHWDESVVEKPESIKSEGLSPVRSSKAKRLVRIKAGYFNPPLQRPIHVPGFHWLGLLLMGLHTKPCLYMQQWWSTRMEDSPDAATVKLKCLKQAVKDFGRRVIHVFDRGYAGAPWLKVLFKHHQHFILRWNKGYKLVDERGRELPCWQLVRGKRSLSKRLIKDTPRREKRQMGIYYQVVFHPKWPKKKLYLVILRPGKGYLPIYLLTNLKITSARKAWTIVFCYARRWQIEAAFRYSKSELALESPRLWFWKNRLKLMMILSVVYAFLLSLLQLEQHLINELLRWGCHRTGKRHQVALVPLYRVRTALMHLWTYTLSQNSG